MTIIIEKTETYQLAEIDGEMKIRDLDLAEKLEMKNPRKIRSLISENLSEIESFGSASPKRTLKERGIFGAKQEVTEYYLNEEQALLVCILSRTPKAKEVRKDLINLYSQYRKGRSLTDAKAEWLIDDLKTMLLLAKPDWAHLIRYHQMGLSGSEIGKLMGKGKTTINEHLRRLMACGFPVEIRPAGGQKKASLQLSFGG